MARKILNLEPRFAPASLSSLSLSPSVDRRGRAAALRRMDACMCMGIVGQVGFPIYPVHCAAH